jgi:RNA polymerase sigma-70 factor (ECF subfamily)
VASDETRLRALMLAGLDGDQAAHRAFLTEVATALRGYFRNRLRAAPEDAEDLLQETLIILHLRRDTYDPSLPLTAWLYAIARYRLIDHLRRTKRRGVSVPIEDAENALFAAPAQNASDARSDVTQLLERLPEKQRTAIRLIKLEEKSVREAAALTGWSESDLKVSAHRGVRALAKLMAQEPER